MASLSRPGASGPRIVRYLASRMTSSQRLHKNDKLWGAIAEALVAAYALIGANG